MSRRKPRELKQLAGTLRKCRDNPGEPLRSAGTPAAPDWLDELSAAYFRQIVLAMNAQHRASPDDALAITLAALALGEVHECSIMIADHGRTYETTNSQGGRMIRPRPEVSQRSDAQRRAQAALGQLGLTPASVGRVSTGDTDDHNPFEHI
jgi:P27 family predicted phage terminase small subunit